MILALTFLLSCQLAGEAVARGLGLPVPGPVLGLAILVALLMLRAKLRPKADDPSATPLGTVVKVLLANLSLLFVPAGVGILRNAPTVADNGMGLLVALLGSTVLTLAVTAFVFRALAARFAVPEASTKQGSQP